VGAGGGGVVWLRRWGGVVPFGEGFRIVWEVGVGTGVGISWKDL
jgi:hypothetical protein